MVALPAAAPRSARLRYRLIAPTDLDALHALACDDHIRRFLFDGELVTRAFCAELIARCADEHARSQLGLWFLYEPSVVAPIGFAGFWSFDGVGDAPQLLYALSPAYARRGFALEAAVAMIDFARARRSLTHVDALVDEPNEASCRLLERLGFERNGEAPGAFGRMFRYRLAAGRPPRVRRTARLIMRPFRAQDLAPFAALNADPRVMEFFPAPLTRDESDALAEQITQHLARHGFSAWALEAPGVSPFIGFTGLGLLGFESHFTPATELAYRLAAEHWGHGYASEAARAALDVAFVQLELAQVVAFTAACNARSRMVMERLGMQRDPREDFDHPRLPAGHPLARHVLYRIDAPPSRQLCTS